MITKIISCGKVTFTDSNGVMISHYIGKNGYSSSRYLISRCKKQAIAGEISHKKPLSSLQDYVFRSKTAEIHKHTLLEGKIRRRIVHCFTLQAPEKTDVYLSLIEEVSY